MSKQTSDMTKAELAEALAAEGYGPGTKSYDLCVAWYQDRMTRDQLVEQVEYARGERTADQLTYRYDH